MKYLTIAALMFGTALATAHAVESNICASPSLSMSDRSMCTARMNSARTETERLSITTDYTGRLNTPGQARGTGALDTGLGTKSGAGLGVGTCDTPPCGGPGRTNLDPTKPDIDKTLPLPGSSTGSSATEAPRPGETTSPGAAPGTLRGGTNPGASTTSAGTPP